MCILPFLCQLFLLRNFFKQARPYVELPLRPGPAAFCDFNSLIALPISSLDGVYVAIDKSLLAGGMSGRLPGGGLFKS